MSSSGERANDETDDVEVSDDEDINRDASQPSLTWHPVWNMFEKFKDPKTTERKAKCLLKTKKGKPCGAIIIDGSTTVAMRHLGKFHIEEHTAVEREKKQIKENSTSKKAGGGSRLLPGQQKLPFSSTSTKYPKEHPKQIATTRKWAMAFVSSSLATSVIENEDFRNALAIMDAKYDPPSRYLLLKEESAMFISMKKAITDQLAKAAKIAITADIWTKRGMSESFYGVTAHWFDKTHGRLNSATLAIRNIYGTHDAKAVYDHTINALNEWSIPISKVSKVVTDNGSNMVKAFRESFQLANTQEIRPIIDHQGEGNPNLNVNFAEVGDPALDASFDESDDIEIDAEIDDFFEQDRLMAAGFVSLERLSCFAHTLQCCIRVLDKTTFASPSRKAAFKLMESFSHSTKATQLLVKKAGKKLLTACKTRWSYNCLAFERLLELRGAVTQVTDELQNIDNLTNTQWSDIERYIKFTKPFANATYSIEGEQYATLSQVIPELEQLRHHLEQARGIDGFIMASAKLIDEIRRRFTFITDPNHPEFDPVYVVATALDPRFRLLLTDEQVTAANRRILHLISTAPDAQPEIMAVDPPANGEPVDYLANLMRERQRAREQVQRNPLADEIESYWRSNHLLGRKADPISFWNDHEMAYPNLASLAQDILAIPATSAPVERLFSQASYAISGKRFNLSGNQLEREVMLKTNRKYF